PELMSAIRMRPTVARRHGAGSTCAFVPLLDYVRCPPEAENPTPAHRRQKTPPEPTGGRKPPPESTGAHPSPPGAPEQKLPRGKLRGLSVQVGAGLAWMGG